MVASSSASPRWPTRRDRLGRLGSPGPGSGLRQGRRQHAVQALLGAHRAHDRHRGRGDRLGRGRRPVAIGASTGRNWMRRSPTRPCGRRGFTSNGEPPPPPPPPREPSLDALPARLVVSLPFDAPWTADSERLARACVPARAAAWPVTSGRRATGHSRTTALRLASGVCVSTVVVPCVLAPFDCVSSSCAGRRAPLRPPSAVSSSPGRAAGWGAQRTNLLRVCPWALASPPSTRGGGAAPLSPEEPCTLYASSCRRTARARGSKKHYFPMDVARRRACTCACTCHIVHVHVMCMLHAKEGFGTFYRPRSPPGDHRAPRPARVSYDRVRPEQDAATQRRPLRGRGGRRRSRARSYAARSASSASTSCARATGGVQHVPAPRGGAAAQHGCRGRGRCRKSSARGRCGG